MRVNEFSRLIEVGGVPPRERAFSIKADQAERDALAHRLGLVALPALSARLRLKWVAGGTLLRLKGTLVADVVQECVVTLEAVSAHIVEEFERSYGSATLPMSEEVVLDLDGPDPPDPIENGSIDIGEAVAEQLALALDPFPRAAGAIFDQVEIAPEPLARPSPFAALAALKKK